MMNGNYSSINLYAQLPIVAEIRPIDDSLRLSAGAVSGTLEPIRDYSYIIRDPGANYSHE